jgi:hypothetical protein
LQHRRACIKNEQMAKYVRNGARYISLNSDLGLLMSAATDRVTQARHYISDDQA